MQIAFNQVLDEPDIVTMQCNEAYKDLYWAAMGKEKQTASLVKELP